MPRHRQNSEFARLALRWLDGSATAAEAARLWEFIRADPACAREFAEQARFDLLLQDTLRERQREQGIATGARREIVRHRARLGQRRAMAVAALVLAAGFLVWLVLPNHGTTVQDVTRAPVVNPPKAVPRAPGIKARHATVLVARQETAKPVADAPIQPLRKRLDNFFLTGVDLDKVPLSLALKQLEDQLRELNFASTADLAALHVQLPPGAGARLVTFHSGSISFLKAARALAGLAGYDVEVSDSGATLVASADGNPSRQESRSVADMLAGLGGSTDPTRNHLDELLTDARALGVQLNLAADGTVSGLRATPGEFQALSLLAQSRDQVRSLPPFQFYVRAIPAPPGSQDRILTGTEADQARSDFLQSASPGTPPVIVSVPMQESTLAGATAQPSEVFASASPVGADRIYLNLIPGPLDTSQPAQQTLNSSRAGPQDPVIAYVPPPDIVQFNTQVPPGTNTIKFTSPVSNATPNAILKTGGLITLHPTSSTAVSNNASAAVANGMTFASSTGNLTLSSSMIGVSSVTDAALSAGASNLQISIIPVTPDEP